VQLADRQGRIVSLNPAGVAAMEAAGDTELIGTRMDDRVIDAHRAAYAELHAAGCDGRAGRLQFQIVSRRGTTRWLDAHTVGLRDASGQYTAVLSVMRDITQQKQIEAEHERLQRQLLNTSRQAGMAEIASGILHNVGNVLNSVNVSASLASERLRKCKLDALQRVVELLRTHQQDIGAFMSEDARGRQIAPYLEQLAQKLAGEQVAILDELALLNRSVDHIRQIVSAQQSYAKCASIAEPYEMSQIVDDAVRMNALSLERHRIDVIRRYAPCPAITGDRHKVLQIFVNLIANAKKAITAARDRTSADRAAPNPALPDGSARTITLVIQSATRAGQPVVRVQVIDSGVGIRAEDLSRIFAHGFTTRSDGHGFGLHTSALAAQQMGGTLSAASEGPGRGATFTLEIPFTPAEVRA